MLKVLLSISALLCVLSCHAVSVYQKRVPWEGMPLVQSSTFIGADTAWLVIANGDLLQTTDRGRTWSTRRDRSMGPLKRVSFIDQNRGWAVNESGEVWTSRDRGLSWGRLSRLEYGERCDALTFIDETHGWAFEPFSLWSTEDGGVSWKRFFPLANNNSITEPFHRFQFLNLKMGWLGGENGAIYHTSDGGRVWNARRTRRNADISALFFLDERRGWLSLRPNCTLLRTDDGGETWSELPAPSQDLELRSIHFKNKNDGWGAGFGKEVDATRFDKSLGVLLRTNDGGQTWYTINPDQKDSFYDKVYFTDEQHGWLVGQKTICYTNDGGDTWNVVLRL